MIFSVKGHIQKIIDGKKTETRRSSEYFVGKSYAIQPKRGVKAIPEGRIRITDIKIEVKGLDTPISWHEADYEGGYHPDEYEELYEKLNPRWITRFAYRFKFESFSEFALKEEAKP
jgi:hypothetical protein